MQMDLPSFSQLIHQLHTILKFSRVNTKSICFLNGVQTSYSKSDKVAFFKNQRSDVVFHIHQWSLYIHQWVSKTNLLIWKNFLNFFFYHYKLIFLSKHSMIFHCNYKFTSYIFTVFSFSYGAHECLQMWLCIWGSMLINRNCTLIRTAFFTSK